MTDTATAVNIAKMQKDIKYIRESHCKDLKTLNSSIVSLDRSINGNGKKGLSERVDDIEKKDIKRMGIVIGISIVVSALITVIGWVV